MINLFRRFRKKDVSKKDISKYRTRTDFPRDEHGDIKWGQVWDEPINCKGKGHIWAVWPNANKGHAMCYKCNLIALNGKN